MSSLSNLHNYSLDKNPSKLRAYWPSLDTIKDIEVEMKTFEANYYSSNNDIAIHEFQGIENKLLENYYHVEKGLKEQRIYFDKMITYEKEKQRNLERELIKTRNDLDLIKIHNKDLINNLLAKDQEIECLKLQIKNSQLNKQNSLNLKSESNHYQTMDENSILTLNETKDISLKVKDTSEIEPKKFFYSCQSTSSPAILMGANDKPNRGLFKRFRMFSSQQKLNKISCKDLNRFENLNVNENDFDDLLTHNGEPLPKSAKSSLSKLLRKLTESKQKSKRIDSNYKLSKRFITENQTKAYQNLCVYEK